MPDNALQQELLKRLEQLRARIALHDRGVLLGVALSVVPVFPVPVFGLLIGMVNRALHRGGKLSSFDYALVKVGLVLAVVTTSFAILTAVWILQLVQVSEIREFLSELMPRVTELLLRWRRNGLNEAGVSV